MKTSLQDCIKYATFRKNIQLVDLLSFQVFFLFFLYKHLGTPHTCIEELLYTLVVRQNYLAIGFHVFFSKLQQTNFQ